MPFTVHKLEWAFPFPKNHDGVSAESFVISNKIRLFIKVCRDLVLDSAIIIHRDPKRFKKESKDVSLVAFARIENLTSDEQLQVCVQTSERNKKLLFTTGLLKPSTEFVKCSVCFMLPLKSAFGELQVELFISTSTAEVSKEDESLINWSSDKIADFTFVVDGTQFKVHKSICIARSAEFRKVFIGSVNNTAVLDGISSGDFSEFLRFMYTSSQEFTNIHNMLSIARKFEVKVLGKVCADRLRSNLSDATAEEAFFIAHEFGDNGLKEDAFKLVQERFDKISCKMPDSLVGKPQAVKDAIEKKKIIGESQNALVNLRKALRDSLKAADA